MVMVFTSLMERRLFEWNKGTTDTPVLTLTASQGIGRYNRLISFIKYYLAATRWLISGVTIIMQLIYLHNDSYSPIFVR
jgi:hypothetical protein